MYTQNGNSWLEDSQFKILDGKSSLFKHSKTKTHKCDFIINVRRLPKQKNPWTWPPTSSVLVVCQCSWIQFDNGEWWIVIGIEILSLRWGWLVIFCVFVERCWPLGNKKVVPNFIWLRCFYSGKKNKRVLTCRILDWCQAGQAVWGSFQFVSQFFWFPIPNFFD